MHSAHIIIHLHGVIANAIVSNCLKQDEPDR